MYANYCGGEVLPLSAGSNWQWQSGCGRSGFRLRVSTFPNEKKNLPKTKKNDVLGLWIMYYSF